jgi:hypothetical protein
VLGMQTASEIDENIRAIAQPIPLEFWQHLKAEGIISNTIPTP